MRYEEATLDIPAANVPPGMDPQVGQTVGHDHLRRAPGTGGHHGR